ncbi:putative quinol monooxygenase [Nonomuraea lactucae]|uniref:putative quinol monooxygenase n=1 Tax=Nonomuraea lactucae TaxID=2249762 RepID=UPI000DE3B9B7|nr:antibiotic biosynthesis monooxygenase [Nonomuraea lactucae]
MEILVAVIAFAGALLAAIATGALVRRLREEIEGWLIAWIVAAAALCLSLAVIGIGMLMGFGAATFKIYQLTGSLLAPFWLAIGLIQLLAEKVPPKFTAWLLGTAFTIVSGVILVVDPLIDNQMTKVLPVGARHWGYIPDKLLIAGHVVVVVITLAAVVVAALRWRSGDEYDTDNLHAVLVIAPSTLAILGAMRFAVPGFFTTALLVVAAAAIWYCVLRPLAPYEDDEDEMDRRDREHAPAGHRSASEGRGGSPVPPRPQPVASAEQPPPMQPPMQPPGQPPGQPPRRASGLGDLVAEYRAGEREIDYAARMTPPPDQGPSTGYIMNGRHGTSPDDFGGPPHDRGASRGDYGPPRQDRQDHGMADTGGPATGAFYPGADLFAGGPPADRRSQQPQAQPASSRPSPSIYGLLTVFTLMDGSGEAFDRLAEQTVEAVRQGEPDTLVYACHAVKSAPLQRIVYELYRDEVAYRDHQRQPHVERFVNERQAMVLATNVIELNVNAAKVVPLPTALF